MEKKESISKRSPSTRHLPTTKFLITVAATPPARDKANPRVDSTPQPLTKQRQRPAAMRASAAGFRVPAPSPRLPLSVWMPARISAPTSVAHGPVCWECFEFETAQGPCPAVFCARACSSSQPPGLLHPPRPPQDLSSMARRADLRPDPPCLRVPFGTVSSSAFGTTSRRVAAAREGGVRDRGARVDR